MKKTILLNLALLFAAAPLAYCQYGGGTGTPNDPYLIYDANQMNAIGANSLDWNKHFKLMADIDLSDFNGLNGNAAFNIIGRDEPDPIQGRNPFTGVFDGNGHMISNFTYLCTGMDVIGLFGTIGYWPANIPGEIKNLGLVDPNIYAEGASYAGGLAGVLRRGRITNCYVKRGSVLGFEDVGGLVGACTGAISNCTIANCHTTCIVVTQRAVAGGVTGCNTGTIVNSYASGPVSGEFCVGGLAAGGDGIITHCYATGDVIVVDSEVGGLVAINHGTVTNCHSHGAVSGSMWVGGLAGRNYEPITNCYSTGHVSGNTFVGGLVGLGVGTVTDSFWDIETSGLNTSAGGTGLTTAEMMTQSTFTSAGWDFNTPVWQMCDELCYPKLAWQQGASIDVPPLLDFGALLDGPNPLPQLLPIGNCLSGTLQWTISEDCNWLSLDVNSGTSAPFDINYVTLTADINGLDYGFYSCDLAVTDPNAQNNPQTFPVTLHVCIHTLGEIFVPDEHPTIQQAIDTAGPNNVVMVDPGTHYENIDFNGKNIKVSSTYPDDRDVITSTIIDGNNQGPVVTFKNREDRNCHLTGFTITDGNHSLEGGGICIYEDASPTISNCIVAANKGSGIYCDRGQPILTRCILAGNTGAGIQAFGKQSATISNCTIVENAGFGLESDRGKSTVINSIIWANGIPSISDRPTVTFSNVEGGSAGLGNIDADPCFVLPGLWVDANDPNIILEPNDPDSVWLQGDYHLLKDSPCIDTGDPNYIPEPNETDLEGNPRVIDGDHDGFAVIDMGAFEFAHTPLEAQMRLIPHTLNRAGKRKFIKAHIVLPEGILAEDIDVNTPAVAEPPGVESQYMKVFATTPVRLEIAFDRQAFCEALTETGEIEVTVTGYLTTGRYFYATDTIRITPNRRQIIPKLLKIGLNKPHSGKLR